MLVEEINIFILIMIAALIFVQMDITLIIIHLDVNNVIHFALDVLELWRLNVQHVIKVTFY